jgi:hypothetical protein
MNTQVLAHPSILQGDHWVGYVRRQKKGDIELYPTIYYVGEKLVPTTMDKLIERDETLAQVQNLPPKMEAWRWEPGSVFSQQPIPVGPTYFFSCEGTPGPDHPERERIGGAFVNVWVRAESKEKAQAIFEHEMKDLGLVLDPCTGPEIHHRKDYNKDPKGKEYFEQAQLDGTVIVCYSYPKYPVYWVTARASIGPPGWTAQVHYFLSADSICQEEEDIFDPSFWTGQRERAAVESAFEAIEEMGWTMISLLDQRPCGRDDVPEALVDGYDEAEESGAGVVSISEGNPGHVYAP